MKKTILLLITVLIFSVSMAFAGEQWPKTDKEFSKWQKEQQVEYYCWIAPVIAPHDPNKTPKEIVWGGDYVFNVKADQGETAKKLLRELKDWSKEIYEDAWCVSPAGNIHKRSLAYREVMVKNSIVTVTRIEKSGRKTMTVDAKKEDDLLRRILYPVEPTAENEWSGWPSK